jgi:hypothetical protein
MACRSVTLSIWYDPFHGDQPPVGLLVHFCRVWAPGNNRWRSSQQSGRNCMACKAGETSIHYGPQGDPTGTVKMECAGECTVQGEECRPVYYQRVDRDPEDDLAEIVSCAFYCRCVKVQGGDYDPAVGDPPLLGPCNGTVRWEVGRKLSELYCAGACHDPELYECQRMLNRDELRKPDTCR